MASFKMGSNPCVFCVLLLMALISSVKTQDYVMPVDGEELLYTTSNVFPRQLSVLNTTAQVGVVVDSENERLAVFNGETGRGVVIDKHLGMGIQIDKGGWSIYGTSFQDYLKDTNLTDLIENNSENVFQLDDQDSKSDATVFVQNTVRRLSPDFLKEILHDAGKFFNGFLKTFGFIMYPLKHALGPVLNMMTPAWVVFKGGFKALLNIFKWMGKLVSKVVGNLPALLKNAVTFPLTAIITALDGAKAFFIMIKELAMKFNLLTILKSIITSPEKMVKFIVGLGGKVLQGMTGVFSLVLRLFTFSLNSIASAIKGLTEMLLNFLRGRRPTYENVKQSVDPLLSIPKDQEKQYKNGDQFNEYNQFLQGFKGEGDYKIQGVNVGGFVKAITKTTETAKVVVMTAMKQLSPLIPFSDSLPQLLVNMVKSLNSTNGASYVETLLPSVKIPKGGLEAINRNIQAEFGSSSSEESIPELRNLPPPALLRKLPVVGQIYSELDDAARSYHNSSLEAMLRNHHTEELMEFTTKALGLTR